MVKESFYFSHDCNARNDIKILAMRTKYGLEGYAMYFMLLEILREQSDYKLPINKYTFKTLAWQFQCDEKLVEAFINDACNEFDLFILEDNYLYSESFLKRMDKYKETSSKMKKLAESRWNKKSDEKKNIHMQCDTQCDTHNSTQINNKTKENNKNNGTHNESQYDSHNDTQYDTQCESHNESQCINKKRNKKIKKEINSFSLGKEKEKEFKEKEKENGLPFGTSIEDAPPAIQNFGEEFDRREF